MNTITKLLTKLKFQGPITSHGATESKSLTSGPRFMPSVAPAEIEGASRKNNTQRFAIRHDTSENGSSSSWEPLAGRESTRLRGIDVSSADTTRKSVPESQLITLPRNNQESTTSRSRTTHIPPLPDARPLKRILKKPTKHFAVEDVATSLSSLTLGSSSRSTGTVLEGKSMLSGRQRVANSRKDRAHEPYFLSGKTCTNGIHHKKHVACTASSAEPSYITRDPCHQGPASLPNTVQQEGHAGSAQRMVHIPPPPEARPSKGILKKPTKHFPFFIEDMAMTLSGLVLRDSTSGTSIQIKAREKSSGPQRMANSRNVRTHGPYSLSARQSGDQRHHKNVTCPASLIEPLASHITRDPRRRPPPAIPPAGTQQQNDVGSLRTSGQPVTEDMEVGQDNDGLLSHGTGREGQADIREGEEDCMKTNNAAESSEAVDMSAEPNDEDEDAVKNSLAYEIFDGPDSDDEGEAPTASSSQVSSARTMEKGKGLNPAERPELCNAEDEDKKTNDDTAHQDCHALPDSNFIKADSPKLSSSSTPHSSRASSLTHDSSPPWSCHHNPTLSTSTDGSIESLTHTTIANDAKDDISQNVEKPQAGTPFNNSQSDTSPSVRSTSSEDTTTDTRKDSQPDPLRSLSDSIPAPTICNDIPSIPTGSIPNIPVGIGMVDLGHATASKSEPASDDLNETEDMDTSEDFPSGEPLIRYPTDIPDSWIPSSLLAVLFAFDYPDHCEPMDVDFD